MSWQKRRIAKDITSRIPRLYRDTDFRGKHSGWAVGSGPYLGEHGTTGAERAGESGRSSAKWHLRPLGLFRGCRYSPSLGHLMKNNAPQLIIMLSGTVLILAGIALIAWQMQHEFATPDFVPQGRSGTLNTSGFTVTTTHDGIIICFVGAFLEIIGYIGAVPWRKVRD